MPVICTASDSPNNCGHRTHTVVWNGVTYQVQRDPTPLSSEERQQFLDLAARVLEYDKGVAASAFVNRVLYGDEATNVKQYHFIGPGNVIAKTNIGTAYVNVCLGANGERILVDFTGCTEFRPVLTANLVGTGPFGFRVVKDADNTVLFENASVALTGERELDPGWLPIPGGFTGLELLRFQAKSTVAADDPVMRRCSLLVR